MTTTELDGIADVMTHIIRDVVSAATLPLVSRITELEARLNGIPIPVNGKDGRDGKDAPPVDMDELSKKVSALVPRPHDGIDGKDGRDGKDAPPVDMDELSKKVSALVPRPHDGIDGKDGRDGKDAVVDTESIARIVLGMLPAPREGRDGLPGQPGAPGRDGKDADPDAVISAVMAKIQLPKDGRDGLGFEDMDERYEGDRTLVRTYRRGELVREFRHTFDMVLDRGVWQAGRTYEKGDGVSWAGSYWIAQESTTAKPGEPGTHSRAWRLAVKRGSDGKRGEPGPAGPKGEDGKRGEKGERGPQGY